MNAITIPKRLRDIKSLGAYSLFVSYAWKDEDAPAGSQPGNILWIGQRNFPGFRS